MAHIEYFYSGYSSYAYMGSERFMEIAAASGREIVHRPVDLHRVLEGCGSTGFSERSLQYRNYFFNRELERWAEFRGVRTLGRRPTYHHRSPDMANRTLIAGVQSGLNIDRLAHRFLQAHWAEDADLSDLDTLTALTEETGLDGPGLLTLAKTEEIAVAYTANTDEAIDRGIFGSPTYFVDGDMFYGQDRLELVERALQKPFAKLWPETTA